MRSFSACRKGVKIGPMNSVILGCALFPMAVTWTEPALARSYLNCLTKKVVIVDAPSGSTSSSIEETLGFWIDETEKTVVLADCKTCSSLTPLDLLQFRTGLIRL